MNAPLRTASFEPTYQHPLARPQHLRPSSQPGRERAVGAAITILAHVAALLLGLHAAERRAPPPAMMVAIEEKRVAPEKLDITMPKFTPPPAVAAPAPMFDIAPSPNAISVTPPHPVAATPPAPPAAPAHGDGRAGYLGELLAQLNRFKQYPPQAKAAHIEGVVMLHFVLDRSGRLLSAEIAQSSGRPALDREALALIARAQPLPPMPAEMGPTLDAVVPINFSLRS